MTAATLRRELLQELRFVSRGRGWAIVMEFILRASQGGYRIASDAHHLPTSHTRYVKGEQSEIDQLETIEYLRKQLPGPSGGADTSVA
jgi:hypothetical protein